MLIRKAFVFTLTLILALGSLTGLGLTSSATAASLPFQGSSNGRLTGTISGPDGVIAGATVVVKDNQTGKEYKVTTNSEGAFEIAQIEFGTYTVTVTAQGFKTYTATELKVNVGMTYSLNATLEVGNISEVVTVTAGAEVINSTNAELSNTVSQRQIQELPLNGRNPLALTALQPGVSQNGSTGTVINGQRISFANITRDGVNVQDNFIRSNATDFVPDRPNVDDVSEFTIVTQNAGAELGYGSAQIQLVTPRGSNQYHGSLYEYNRNSELASNTFFNNAAKVDRPFLNRNQYGGRIGGPIIKDKVFFFGSYEGFRQRQSTSVNRTILLPTARNGIFTYNDNSGVRRTVNVLGLTGLPFDPTIQSRILSKIPTAGNTTAVGDQLNTTGFQLSRQQNQDRDGITSRFDWEINDRNHVNVVYAYKKEFLQRPDVDAQPGGAGAGFTSVPFGNQDANTPFLAASYNQTITERLTNEIRGGFQISDPKFDRTDKAQDFFISIPLISNPESAFERQGRNTKIINFQDNAVYAHGQHSFRFGGQSQIFRVNPYGPGAFGNSWSVPTFAVGTNVNTPQLTGGQFPGGISSAQLTTANNLLALLAGIVGAGNLTFTAATRNSGLLLIEPNRNLNYENYSGYFSDSWRITPHLTVNLGLRYELFSSIKEPNSLALEPAIGEDADPVAAVLNPNGRYVFVGNNSGKEGAFFTADKNNFAPIISAAWSPEFKSSWLKAIFPDNGRTVLRGGYRESYVNDEFVRAADNALAGNAGLTQQIGALNPLTGSTSLNARFNALPGFTAPELIVPRTFAQNNTPAFGRFGTVFAIDPGLRIPRTQEYNFSIERDIGFNTALEIRYVGGRSSNLVRGKDFNQVDIFNNGFVTDFIKARNNMVLTGGASGNPACTTAQNPGCQPLTVFPLLANGGLLTNGTIRANIFAGVPADLAVIYIQNGLTGTVKFLPNPNTGVADLLLNDARFNYNGLQTEIRRRFSNGLYFQANYTFSKVLTDAAGVGQTRFDPPLSLFAPNIEYARAAFDQTHAFNLNTIYELPFGKGKPFLNQGGWSNRLFGGFQVTSIVRWASGAPISILDPNRGTLNRGGRSGSQTAVTSLNKEQIKDLIGIRKTKCGVFFIDPKVINFNVDTCTGTGRGSEGFGTTPFAGQVFFNNAPGTTSGLERAFINGPIFFNWDASIIKNVELRESMRLQFRVEAFNIINRTNFFSGDLNINSTSFGRVTQTFGSRILQLVGRFEF